MAKNQRIPRLGRHAPSGQGRVRLNEVDHYLGVWPDGEVSPPKGVKAAYDRLIAEWLAGGRKRVAKTPTASATLTHAGVDAGPCEGLTVVEMAVQYMKHCRTYYRHPGGEPTGEAENVAGALRPLVYLFGTTAAASFGALALGRVVDLMVSGYAHPEYGGQVPLTRPGVNARLGRIKNAFGWAVSKELIPPSIGEAVRSVKPLAPGRTEAKETPAVKPVPESVVEATLPFLPPSPLGMVLLQNYTGCRPGEACGCLLEEIDRSGAIWTWKPKKHKNAWRKKERVISIGPRGQLVLLSRIRIRCAGCGREGRPSRLGSHDLATCGDCAAANDAAGRCAPWRRIEAHPPGEYLFSPARDKEEKLEARRAARKSKVQPSQRDRSKKGATRVPGIRYRTSAYAHAVAAAALAAGVESWRPNRLRHLHGTRVRQAFNLEAAAATLGHADVTTTLIYS